MYIESHKTHIRKTFLLAYPVVISQLGHMVVNLTDSILVGKLGPVTLAACSLGISFFAIFMVVGIGIAYGLTPLVARAHGAGEIDKPGILLANSLIINIVSGILIAGLIFLLSPQLSHLGQDPEVVKAATPFLRIIGFSIIPLMVFLSFKQFAEGLSFTKQAMQITLIADAINVVLTIGLIYGKWGLPELGLRGAGLANFLARCLMAILMTLYIIRSKHFKPYLLKFKFRLFNKNDSREIIRLGIPTALQYLFEVGAFSVSAMMVGSIGANPQAAHQIAISLASVTYMAASGIGAAATVRVGNALGERNLKQLRRAGFSAYLIVIGFMLCCGLGFIVFRHVLPTFYIHHAEVVEIAAGLLIMAAIFQVSDGVQVVGLGALRGMGDVKIPTLIALLAYWVIAIPLGYYMGFVLNFGVNGIWYALSIGLTIAAILLIFRFNYLSKKILAEQPMD